MVPVIDPPSAELAKVVNYNEHKVQRGVAEFLYAHNFLKPKEELNIYDKLHRFQKLNELNERSEKNTLHISLNFHPSDQLTKEQLCEIAALYMDKIGLGNQPYLVYQHHDSGHPHVHIVSTLIQPDGKRFRTQNIGKNQSTQARREIDQLFGLRKVEESKHSQAYEPIPVNAQKVIYGRLETKKAIKDVLRFVLEKYKFTSLPELNAVLQQYNVLADRGDPDSRIYQNGGLVYRVLDEQGSKTGVPIKASDFHFKPTLASLQGKFEKNEPLRKADIPSIKSRIDWVLGKQPKSFKLWLEELRKENILAVIRRNEQGIVYGLTYVDFKTRSVLNGSDLGKAYSARAITQRFNGPAELTAPPKIPLTNQDSKKKRTRSASKKGIPTKPVPPVKPPTGPEKKPAKPIPAPSALISQPLIPALPVAGGGNTLLNNLITEQAHDPLPYELTTDLKKKKRKRLHQ